VPVVVLSDGVERFIREILARAGIAAPTIRANAVVHRGRALSLRPLHGASVCPVRSAHCKCESMRELGCGRRRAIYVGDGRSDLCAARTADIVFAKGALAAALDKEHRAFTLFSTLDDVASALESAWRCGVAREIAS
jgi:2-hydroxy-3-keto-5-methylthiopentenyl-1-phosphate phosphatase